MPNETSNNVLGFVASVANHPKVVSVRHVEKDLTIKVRIYRYFWVDYVYKYAKKTKLNGQWEAALSNGDIKKFFVERDDRNHLSVSLL